ncbi:PLP-dependent aminotransferase family protein [Cohnella caldifontis]|uniref:MocR-like pyridoxine biosynthesis transcription factor PdxR n=1 Tax=Cohnella caldifontis TaxID=3027471 RepID=UPI0023ED267F|nr:PLP-dependent aminotransferase family protein [Cohnella sp. YIM B05605]
MEGAATFDIMLPESDGQPVYQRLYEQIRDRIRSGEIADGARLPSVRALQDQLNTSKTPIETAYQMLIAEGYVVSRPRSGLYVSNPYPAPTPEMTGVPRTPESTVGISPAHTLHASSGKQAVIDFDPARLDAEAFPLRIWSKMLREAFEAHANEIGNYGDPMGEYGLRAELADYLRSSRGVRCTPEQIAVGTGMAHSIDLLTHLLKDVRLVAMEEPGYHLVRNQLQLNGRDIVPIPLGDKGLALDVLEESRAQAVYVTPSHQFPTGFILPYPERKRLLEWADRNGAYVIEDDYDGEFRYVGKPIPSLQGLDEQGRVVYIGTFSKAFTPALRMNYMVLPMELAEQLARMPHEAACPPARAEQWAMQRFMAEGHWYRHIRKIRGIYRKKHAHLIGLIHERLGPRVEITGQNAGLHLQLTLQESRSSDELIGLAAQAGVRVYDLRKMWMDEERRLSDEPRLYLGFAGLKLKDMEKGIRLLEQAWFNPPLPV